MKNQLKIFFSFFLVFLIIILTFLVYSEKQKPSNRLVIVYPTEQLATTTLTVDGKTYTTEVVTTPAEWEQGLSGRAPLAEGTGMLFVFDNPGNYGFWMKDMNFPLDIIWVGSDFHIVHIEKNLAPSTYPTVYYPNAQSLYVLEILAGQTDKNNIKIDDLVEISKD